MRKRECPLPPRGANTGEPLNQWSPRCRRMAENQIPRECHSEARNRILVKCGEERSCSRCRFRGHCRISGVSVLPRSSDKLLNGSENRESSAEPSESRRSARNEDCRGHRRMAVLHPARIASLGGEAKVDLLVGRARMGDLAGKDFRGRRPTADNATSKRESDLSPSRRRIGGAIVSERCEAVA
jgi:hypothetical protein